MSSIVSTITMSTLIEEVLDILHRPTERPRAVVAGAAIDSSQTTITVDAVAAANLAPTDLLEFDRELMLVTAVSGTTITVSRGYNGTTAAGHTISTAGTINAPYPRHIVDRSIRKCVSNSLQAMLPCMLTEVSAAPDNLMTGGMRPVDELTVHVHDVRYRDTTTGIVRKLTGRWTLEDWMSADGSYTGKAVRLPKRYWGSEVMITRSGKYTWTGSGETATLDVPLGSEDLPVKYAVAMLQTGMEISRQEFDQIEEWPQQERQQRSANIRLLQTLWGEYFAQLDRAIGLQDVPVHRPYQRMAHTL